MTKGLVEVLVLAANVAAFIPVTVFFVECVAALWPMRSRASPDRLAQGRIAVLVPAHNEASGIAATLQAIRPQLMEGDRLLVIADNCSDKTADRARGEAAEVVERFDEVRRGKGFALAHGLEHLKAQPPDVVVFIDADSRAEPGAILALRTRALETGGPVQGVNLLDIPPDAGSTGCLSAFAFLTKNLVRPAGLARLGIPCHLLGTGMAIPWGLIDIAQLATGNLVEDMQQGIDLAIRGSPPRLCLEARVSGCLPAGQKGALVQRTRWEHGHLGTILTQCPRMAWEALRQGRPVLLGMAFDLAVPPLALLCLIWALVAAASLFPAFRGWSKVPAIVAGISGGMILVAVLLAWVRHARALIPGRILILVPLYILWKIPLYVAFLFRRQKAWVRTPRDASPGPGERNPSGPDSP